MAGKFISGLGKLAKGLAKIIIYNAAALAAALVISSLLVPVSVGLAGWACLGLACAGTIYATRLALGKTRFQKARKRRAEIKRYLEEEEQFSQSYAADLVKRFPDPEQRRQHVAKQQAILEQSQKDASERLKAQRQQQAQQPPPKTGGDSRYSSGNLTDKWRNGSSGTQSGSQNSAAEAASRKAAEEAARQEELQRQQQQQQNQIIMGMNRS